MVAVRNGFHMSITARRILAVFLGPSQVKKASHAGLGAIRAAEPDRPPPQEIADDDAIGVPFPDRHLVDADDLRPWGAGAPQLLTHILLLERLD